MRTAALALLVALGGCMEPSKGAQREQIISGLADLHTWDVKTQGEGQYAYDAVVSSWPEIGHQLAYHLTDEKPTAIYEKLTQRNPVVGDVCFLMLLKLAGLQWQSFSRDGVFVSTALPNPIFCITWDPGARQRVQKKFLEILPPPEDKP
jgi:hypothetical protein